LARSRRVVSAFGGKAGHSSDFARCPLMTQSGHGLLKFVATRPLNSIPTGANPCCNSTQSQSARSCPLGICADAVARLADLPAEWSRQHQIRRCSRTMRRDGSRSTWRGSLFGSFNRRAPTPGQTNRAYLQIHTHRPRTTIRFERGYRGDAQTIPVRLDPHRTARTDLEILYSRDRSSAPVLL
jgi:hypothetical protein